MSDYILWAKNPNKKAKKEYYKAHRVHYTMSGAGVHKDAKHPSRRDIKAETRRLTQNY